MIPIELDQEIREGAFKTLPRIMNIQNEELQNKTADAWTCVLQINGFKQIEEMSGSGMSEASALGDQSMHIRAVGYNTPSLYENLSRAYKMDLGLDKDILIASAPLHDIGRPYEYSLENRKRWRENHKTTGAPNMRHPAYGTHIAITCELPGEVVHMCANHSPEGRFVTRSAYATLVHYADDGSWFSLASIFDLNIPKLWKKSVKESQSPIMRLRLFALSYGKKKRLKYSSQVSLFPLCNRYNPSSIFNGN